MRTRFVKDAIGRAHQRQEERHRGRLPGLLRTAANTATHNAIADPSKLPLTGDPPGLLQSPSGTPYFMVGYSLVGGDDIVAP